MRKMKLTNAVVSMALIAGLLSPMQAQATEIATEDVMDVIEVTTEEVTEGMTEEVTEVATEEITEEVPTEEPTEEVVEPSVDEVTDETVVYGEDAELGGRTATVTIDGATYTLTVHPGFEAIHYRKTYAMAQAFYNTLLGRRGEPAGIAYWMQAMIGGGAYRVTYRGTTSQGTASYYKPAMVGRYVFFHSDEFQQKEKAGLSKRAAVKAFYNAYLGRNPEQTGWDYWTNLYELGMDKSSLTYAMIKTAPSKEFETRCAAAGFVTEDLNGLREFPRSMKVEEAQAFGYLYQGLLSRKASSAELQGKINQFRSGKPFHRIAYEMMISEECIWKTLDDEDFIQAAYQGILHRKADAAGMALYKAQLASVHHRNNNPNLMSYSYMNREEILYALINSQEFRNLYGTGFGSAPVFTSDMIMDYDKVYISRLVKAKVFAVYPLLTTWNTDGEFMMKPTTSHENGYISSHIARNRWPYTTEDIASSISGAIFYRMKGSGREPGIYDGFSGFAFYNRIDVHMDGVEKHWYVYQ